MAKLLIDGDILAYKASSSVQKDIDWGDGLWTCHAYLEDAVEQFRNLLDNILFALKETTLEDYSISDMMFFFSDEDNFRKHYLPEYKSNRRNSRKTHSSQVPLVGRLTKAEARNVATRCRLSYKLSFVSTEIRLKLRGMSVNIPKEHKILVHYS
jgi:5'-3' exonuclease